MPLFAFELVRDLVALTLILKLPVGQSLLASSLLLLLLKHPLLLDRVGGSAQDVGRALLGVCYEDACHDRLFA